MRYVILVLVVIFVLYSFIYHKAFIQAYKKGGVSGVLRMYLAMFTHVIFKMIMPED